MRTKFLTIAKEIPRNIFFLVNSDFCLRNSWENFNRDFKTTSIGITEEFSKKCSKIKQRKLPWQFAKIFLKNAKKN